MTCRTGGLHLPQQKHVLIVVADPEPPDVHDMRACGSHSGCCLRRGFALAGFCTPSSGRLPDVGWRVGPNLHHRITLEDPLPTNRALEERQGWNNVGLTLVDAGPVSTDLLDLIASTGWAMRDVCFGHGFHKAFLQEIKK